MKIFFNLRYVHNKLISYCVQCLWKTVRLIPDVMNELNVDRVFGDIHSFLKAFPTSSWRGKPSDLPLKTVKTLLHSIIKQLGPKVCIFYYSFYDFIIVEIV